MQIELSEKQALVTGSTAGIGPAIATGLANAGAQVTIVGRDEAGAIQQSARMAFTMSYVKFGQGEQTWRDPLLTRRSIPSKPCFN